MNYVLRACRSLTDRFRRSLSVLSEWGIDVHEMSRRGDVRLGLATLCIGVGQGIAMVVEKI